MNTMFQTEPQGEDLRARLPEGHVLHTLISEHDAILGFLPDLEAANERVQAALSPEDLPRELTLLEHLSRMLLEAESHHQREEQVLFPELERRGITGPPACMRHEHSELRARKKALRELLAIPHALELDDFKARLSSLCTFLTSSLRTHILKENTILFPCALDVIPDQETWTGMKTGCDDIGYCSFTPDP